MTTRKRFTSGYVSRLVVGVIGATVVLCAFASKTDAAPTIRFRGNGLDRFKIHGRVKLDPPFLGGPVDPLTSGFRIEVWNDYGRIYSGALRPGDLEPRRGFRYVFKDKGALRGDGIRAGLYVIANRFRKYANGWYYTIRVRAFADFSAATAPFMMVLVHEVGGTAVLAAEWVRKPYGWLLPLDRF